MNKNMRTVSVFLFVLTTQVCFSVERYVPGEYATLQSAISECNDGDVIILDPNTYTGVGFMNLSFSGRAITIQSTDPNDPNVVAATIIDCNGQTKAFTFDNNEDGNSVLNGLTISNGYSFWGGGAIRCERANPTIKNCRFISCKSPDNGSNGGAIFYREANDINIENCVFNKCLAAGAGGAVCFQDCNNVVINRCEFSYNYSDDSMIYGVSYSMLGNSLYISDCNVSYNYNGYAIYSRGMNLAVSNSRLNNNYKGAIHIGEAGHSQITGCEIRFNGEQPAIYVDASSHTSSSELVLDINNCDISNNIATGVHFAPSSLYILNILNSKINYNTSDGPAAGISGCDNLRMDNCQVCYNSVTGSDCQGVAIGISTNYYISRCLIKGNSYADEGMGAGLYSQGNGEQKVENCIIIQNSATTGGAIYGECAQTAFYNCIIAENFSENISGGGAYFYNSDVNFINCTIANNFGSGIFSSGSSINILNTVLAENLNANYESSSGNEINVGFSLIYPCADSYGSTVITEEPHLAADYHLTVNSPCIDAGDPCFYYDVNSRDIDGESRGCGIIDIGADEFIDDDNDGLPNFWEEKYFGNITIADANVDSDGDDIINLTEYQDYGTEPNIPPITYYVSPLTGDNDYDGLSAVSDGNSIGPKRNVSNAIALCRDNHNDRIIMLPASYTENLINPLGKAVVVSSFNPDDPNIVKNTVLTSPQAFRFTNFEKRSTVIDGLTMANLSAPMNSVMYIEKSSPMIRNCVISECLGIYIQCFYGKPEFINDKFRLNRGNIFFHGAAASIKNCRFDQNGIVSGRAIHSEGSMIDIEGSYFFRNNIVLMAYSSMVSVKNSVLKANNCGQYGTMLFSMCPDVEITNCTIFGNSMTNSTQSYPAISCENSSLDMTNSILRSPYGTKISMNNSTVNVNYCNIQGGWPIGEGNFDATINLTPDGHLLAGSPCIDAGTGVNCPLYDIDGELRSGGGLPDVGADEYKDSDNDSLPDFFAAMCVIIEPNNDDDSDGYTNRQEYELYSSNPDAHYQTYYVASYGGADNNGLSWDFPKKSISQAVAAADDGDKIIISENNYSDGAICFYGKAIVLQSVNPDDAESVNNTLMPCGVNFRYGEGKGSKICGVNINKSMTETGGAYNAVYCMGTGPTVEKCIISNSNFVNDGAGIYCENASPVIIDCNISCNNSANGAALYGRRNNTPYLFGCKIAQNYASHYGSAIYLAERNSAIIEQCEIEDNTAYDGGTVYCEDTNLMVVDSVLSGNMGGGNEMSAGIYCVGAEEFDVNINGCVFTQNTGGGVYINNSSQSPDLVIENSEFSYNSERPALRIYSEQTTSFDIKKCSFYGNMNGAMELGLQNAERIGVQNCLFTGNYAFGDSAFYINSNNAPINIENCTIAYNISGDTSNCGSIFTASSNRQLPRSKIMHSIIYGNTNVKSDCQIDLYNMSSYWDILYCNWQNLGFMQQMHSNFPFVTCMDLEPLFLDEGFWDDNGTTDPQDDIWMQGDYHLQSSGWVWFDGGMKGWTSQTSRCVDAGNPSASLGDEPIYGIRDLDGSYGINRRINMGAYGGTEQASIPPNNWMLQADINNDGRVDIYELDILIGFYLFEPDPQMPVPVFVDFNHDGIINLADYAILADEWQCTASWRL